MNTLQNWWPAWAAVAIASLVAINQLITESQKIANMFGRVGRWLYERSRQRARMDTKDFTKAVREAVGDERKRWEEDEARALKAVEGRLSYIVNIAETQQKEMEELSWAVRCHTAYAEYEAHWHHELHMLALKNAENGRKVSIDELPPYMSYADFERKCRETGNMNWRWWFK